MGKSIEVVRTERFGEITVCDNGTIVLTLDRHFKGALNVAIANVTDKPLTVRSDGTNLVVESEAVTEAPAPADQDNVCDGPDTDSDGISDSCDYYYCPTTECTCKGSFDPKCPVHGHKMVP